MVRKGELSPRLYSDGMSVGGLIRPNSRRLASSSPHWSAPSSGSSIRVRVIADVARRSSLSVIATSCQGAKGEYPPSPRLSVPAPQDDPVRRRITARTQGESEILRPRYAINPFGEDGAVR